ncbi:unnamed protein product [Chondrus crispus]|uniref:Secreted protein n=1 Tax=Chondrus crispus TaxID=2769 RepID=R7QLD1_CHOCR|nr:unnamed protein product [Chondrus crispus]CDF38286.1 unnamed protein product [Chondrus crispus]|eukprot:XP_005718171.1 unnamed protein product [Chondrus crispus]
MRQSLLLKISILSWLAIPHGAMLRSSIPSLPLPHATVTHRVQLVPSQAASTNVVQQHKSRSLLVRDEDRGGPLLSGSVSTPWTFLGL